MRGEIVQEALVVKAAARERWRIARTLREPLCGCCGRDMTSELDRMRIKMAGQEATAAIRHATRLIEKHSVEPQAPIHVDESAVFETVNARVLKMRQDGYTFKAIGEALGVRPCEVGQIVRRALILREKEAFRAKHGKGKGSSDAR